MKDQPRRSVWSGDTNHDHTVTVYEREPEQRPVLYDAKGQPLARPKRPLGFQPPGEHR